MAEQVWKRPHGPTAIAATTLASEQDTYGHSHDHGDQAQHPGHHHDDQEPPEHAISASAREVTSAHGSAKENGAGVSGLGPPARQETTLFLERISYDLSVKKHPKRQTRTGGRCRGFDRLVGGWQMW